MWLLKMLGIHSSAWAPAHSTKASAAMMKVLR
jgi:hypothetical protein